MRLGDVRRAHGRHYGWPPDFRVCVRNIAPDGLPGAGLACELTPGACVIILQCRNSKIGNDIVDVLTESGAVGWLYVSELEGGGRWRVSN